MGLLRKMRILVGALVHRPFMSQPEKVPLEESPKQAVAPETYPPAGVQVSQQIEEERVADLIAARKADAGEEAGKTGSNPGGRERERSS